MTRRTTLARSIGTAIGLFAPAFAYGQAFTYQGRVELNGTPVNGPVNLGFVMTSDAAGSAILGAQGLPNVAVRDGLFTVTLNDAAQFGPNAFTGGDRWLQVAVNSVPLLPRQKITSAPYAAYARDAGEAATAATAVHATSADFADQATVAQSVPGVDGNSLNGPGGTPVDALTVNGVGTVTVGATRLFPTGRVGINVSSPIYPLEIASTGNCEMVLRSTDGGGNGWNIVAAGVQGAAEDFAFQIVDRSINRSRLTILKNSGMTVVDTLQIRGGADIAEPFAVSAAETPAPGSVMCIDPANPGKLRAARKAYDRTVAGVVSGAGGVNAGVTLRQEDTLADGNHPVALAGRVYVLVDADANGSIEPGDLLTTSDTPAHAMKADDPERSGGAVIGKAMTGCKQGKGLVLVLVSLQ